MGQEGNKTVTMEELLKIATENRQMLRAILKAIGAEDSNFSVEAETTAEKQPITENTIVDEKATEKLVTEYISGIGIPASIKGYYYSRTAIIMLIKEPDYMNYVTKNLYPDIARVYKTTPSRVERAIRHAVEIAWQRGNVEEINKVFGYTINSEKRKPTNSEFLGKLADRIRILHN